MVIAVPSRDYGKPRPCLVIQSDRFRPPSVTIAPITSEMEEIAAIRIPVEPGPDNGLQVRSLVMCDKIQTIPIGKTGRVVGRLDGETMRLVDSAIGLFLGLA